MPGQRLQKLCDKSVYVYLIKKQGQDTTDTENVTALMKMSLGTPDFSDMYKFNFSGAFEIWYNVKYRYICRN